MNKLLNKKVSCLLHFQGCLIQVLTLKSCNVRYLNFCQCDFLSVMDYTVLHILDS